MSKYTKPNETDKAAFVEAMIPADEVAEKAVLACILRDQDLAWQVMDRLAPDDFHDSLNRVIYQAMCELIKNDHSCNPVAVQSLLREWMPDRSSDGHDELMYHYGRLQDLYNTTAGNINEHADVVIDLSIRRQVFFGSQQIAGWALTEKAPETLRKLQEFVTTLQLGYDAEVQPVANFLDDIFRKVNERHEGGAGPIGIPTRWTELDRIIKSLRSGSLYIIGGRPAVGKSLTSMCLGLECALQNIPVLYLSIEMSREQLIYRLLATLSGLNPNDIEEGNLNDQISGIDGKTEWDRFSEAMATLSSIPLYIQDAPAGAGILNVEVMTMKFRAMTRDVDPEHRAIMFLDYLQLLTPEKVTNVIREQLISGWAWALKLLAKRCDMTVICMSQLSRATDIAPEQKPQNNHLRESGGLENHADVIILLWYLYLAHPDDESLKHLLILRVTKNRHGRSGDAALYINHDAQRVGNREWQHTQAPVVRAESINPFETLSDADLAALAGEFEEGDNDA